MKKFILMTITVLFSPILMASDTGFVTTTGKAYVIAKASFQCHYF